MASRQQPGLDSIRGGGLTEEQLDTRAKLHILLPAELRDRQGMGGRARSLPNAPPIPREESRKDGSVRLLARLHKASQRDFLL